MHELQRVQKRSGYEVELLLGRRRVETLQPLLERVALDEIEQHVGGIIGLEYPPNADDIGVVELRQQARLVVELLEAPKVVALAVRLGGEADGRAFANDEVFGEKLLESEVLLER